MISQKRAAEFAVEDVAFTENAHGYPIVEKQRVVLDKTHVVKYVRTSPDKGGHPVKRRRTFGAAVTRGLNIWVGPENDQYVQADFDNFYNRTIEANGDLYFCADKTTVLEMVNAIAKRRRNTLPTNYKDVDMADYLDSLLTEGQKHRKRDYDQEYADQISTQPTWIADLDQNTSHHPPGVLVPPLDTHPLLFSWGKKRLAHPYEMLGMQGFDMFPELAGPRPLCKRLPLFKKMELNELKLVAGNSLHIPTFTAWCVYVLGNIVAIRDISRMSRHLSARPSETDEDDL